MIKAGGCGYTWLLGLKTRYRYNQNALSAKSTSDEALENPVAKSALIDGTLLLIDLSPCLFLGGNGWHGTEG